MTLLSLSNFLSLFRLLLRVICLLLLALEGNMALEGTLGPLTGRNTEDCFKG